MTEHTEPRLTAQDLRTAADMIAGRLPSDLVKRLEAHADRLDALWAVLDALSEADAREAAMLVRGLAPRNAHVTGLTDRLEAAADALHALNQEES